VGINKLSAIRLTEAAHLYYKINLGITIGFATLHLSRPCGQSLQGHDGGDLFQKHKRFTFTAYNSVHLKMTALFLL
jgi:hypothetical protein